MKKIIAVVVILLCAFVSQAQMKTIVLSNGLTVRGTVHQTADGIYVIKNEAGEEFFYSASEIKAIKSLNSQGIAIDQSSDIREGMSYSQLRIMYNARNYQADPWDRFNVGGMTTAAFFCPFIGVSKLHYYGGIATGIFQIGGFGMMAIGIGLAGYGDAGGYDYLVSGFLIYTAMGAIDAITVNRRAKIYNQYYRDLGYNQKRKLSMSVDPFVSMTPNTVFASSQPTAGLSLKLSF